MKESVCVVLFNPLTGKIVLVTRRNSTEVGLPGGKVDPGEQKYAAMRRELWEETGIYLHESPKAIALYEGICTGEVDYLTTCYFSIYTGSLPGGCEEGITTKWGTVDELITNSPFKDYNVKLLHACLGHINFKS